MRLRRVCVRKFSGLYKTVIYKNEDIVSNTSLV